MIPLPTTPPPQDRPFERIALNSSELPRACWWWMPLTVGLVAANWFLIPLSMLVILGGCWRFLCLRSLRSAGVESGWLSLWRRFTAAWCLGGLVAVGLIFATGALGLSETIGSRAFAAWGIWRFLPLSLIHI